MNTYDTEIAILRARELISELQQVMETISSQGPLSGSSGTPDLSSLNPPTPSNPEATSAPQKAPSQKKNQSISIGRKAEDIIRKENVLKDIKFLYPKYQPDVVNGKLPASAAFKQIASEMKTKSPRRQNDGSTKYEDYSDPRLINIAREYLSEDFPELAPDPKRGAPRRSKIKPKM